MKTKTLTFLSVAFLSVSFLCAQSPLKIHGFCLGMGKEEVKARRSVSTATGM